MWKWKLQWELTVSWGIPKELLFQPINFHFDWTSTWISELKPKDAEYYSCSCSVVSCSPELCHFGFRKGGLWRGYLLIWYIRGSLYRSSCLSRLIRDFLLPIYQGHLRWHVATQIKGSEWMNYSDCLNECVCILESTPCTHLSAVVVAGGAGLLGVVGDGCSCFSMVSFTNSCSQKDTTVSFSGTREECRKHYPHFLYHQRTYLYSIQHCFDDTGDRRHIFLVLQVNAIQHHLVCPTDKVGQTLIHAVMAGRQRRTVWGKGWDNRVGENRGVWKKQWEKHKLDWRWQNHRESRRH